MITAIVFDMNGVLVDNQKLKGLSAGMPVQGLREPRELGIPGQCSYGESLNR